MPRLTFNSPYPVRRLVRDVNKANQLTHPDETIVENSHECFKAAFAAHRKKFGKKAFFKRNVVFEAALTISVSLRDRLAENIQGEFVVNGEVAERKFTIQSQKRNPDFANVAALVEALVAHVERENPGALAKVQFERVISESIARDNERLCCGMSNAERKTLQTMDASEASRHLMARKKMIYIAAAAALVAVTAALVSIALFACITSFFPILTVCSVIIGLPLAITAGFYAKTFAERATTYHRLSTHANALFTKQPSTSSGRLLITKQIK